MYEKTLSCRTNPSPIRFCTGDHGLAEPNRNHRLAPHNSAKRTDAKANTRRSLDQTAPGQAAPGQAAPRHAQGAHQTKWCQNNRRTPTRVSSAGDPYCAKLILLRIQFVRENLVCRTQSFTDPVLYGRPRPCRTKSESQASTSQLRQADRRQGKRRTPSRASTRRANPSGQATPDQAAPGIQTEIASPQGDRRFQLQRSGTISSGPLKKLRVSCVHERDGKQVPCVRSLCSYARESRAC